MFAVYPLQTLLAYSGLFRPFIALEKNRPLIFFNNKKKSTWTSDNIQHIKSFNIYNIITRYDISFSPPGEKLITHTSTDISCETRNLKFHSENTN